MLLAVGVMCVQALVGLLNVGKAMPGTAVVHDLLRRPAVVRAAVQLASGSYSMSGVHEWRA